MTQQFDSSLIPSDADHDRHYLGNRVECDECGRLFSQEDDESLCQLCAHDAIENDIYEMLATVAAVSHAEKDAAWKLGYLTSFVASMAMESQECLDYIAARKIIRHNAATQNDNTTNRR